MSINFTPNMGEFTGLKTFRHWCQKVLPAVYDDSLSYYELLCKVVAYLNTTMQDVNVLHEDVVNLYKAYTQLQNYVNSYFDNLDVQEEINNKLDEMVDDGTLSAIVNKMVNAKFYDVASIEVAGQVVFPEGRTNVQSFCADDEYVYFFCTTDGTTTDLAKYSITNGVLLNTFRNIGGKIASCGIMGDYIICAHNLSDILVLTKTGATVKTLSIEGVDIYAVTADDKYIYCVDGNNPATLYRLDFDGNILLQSELSVKRNMTMQSIKSIGDNIYMTLFDSNYRLYVESVYTKEGTFVTNISIPVKTELEDICVINEKTYVITNNFGSGTLFEVSLQAFPITINYTALHNQTKTLTNVEIDTYYFNNNSYNLWYNGKSSDKPLNKLLNIFNLFHDYQTRLDVQILSDYEEGIVLRYCSQWLQILGNNHTIGGLFIENNENLLVKNLTMNGDTYARNSTVYISGGRAEFVSCTFNCVDEDNILETSGVEVSLTSCTFTGNNPTQANIRAINGTYNVYNALTFNNFVENIIRDGISIHYTLNDTSWLSANAPLNGIVILGSTIRLSQLKATGCYRIGLNAVESDYNIPLDVGFIDTKSKSGLLSHLITTRNPNYMYNIIIGNDFVVKKKITCEIIQ